MHVIFKVDDAHNLSHESTCGSNSSQFLDVLDDMQELRSVKISIFSTVKRFVAASLQLRDCITQSHKDCVV